MSAWPLYAALAVLAFCLPSMFRNN